jgi:hypothetical protein
MNGAVVAQTADSGSQRYERVRQEVSLAADMRTWTPQGNVPIAVELRRADVAGMNVTRPS